MYEANRYSKADWSNLAGHNKEGQINITTTIEKTKQKHDFCASIEQSTANNTMLFYIVLIYEAL